MTTTLTPPPLPPVPGPDPQRRRPSASVVAILAIVVGGVLILGTIVGASLSAVAAADVRDKTLTAPLTGLDSLQVDISAADLTIDYGPVDEARLEISGTPSGWSLTAAGDALVVRSDRSWWSSFGNWGGLGAPDRAVLTLPAAFEDRVIDASLALSAGSITADGAYDALTIDLSAGDIDVTGTAETLDVESSAGRVSLGLADVASGTVQVSAGAVVGSLTGTTPSLLDIDASAGRVDLALPADTYRVTSDVSAGSFDNRLETADSAAAQVDVTVSAGEVALRPAN